MAAILETRAELKPYMGGTYYLWNYVPSKALAIVALLVFLGLTILNAWRMFRTRTWFTSVLVIGGIFEVIGFAARAKAENETDQLMPYVLQNMFILIAPTCFAATIYMTLGRIIRSVRAEHLSPIRVKWLTKIFLLGDVVSFWFQGMSTPFSFIAYGKYSKWGQVLILIGLLCQIVSFGLFWAVAVMFRKRIRATPTDASLQTGSTWMPAIRMLYYVSGLVMARSIFRLVEYGQTVVGSFTGSATIGYLELHEWPMYLFDSILMALVMIFFYWWFPQGLQPADKECGAEIEFDRQGHSRMDSVA